ncbi:restriction endonuclease subunit S [Lactobacillus delbrueckii]|uniref:restriction endonuclease subunit S n=1 Tax=Lactobacillus delbrueckii TaxID=1584 RepID=UPI0022E7C5E2|nr:restriction endonuclease subunit S [Lactobacillus delbrueckii]
MRYRVSDLADLNIRSVSKNAKGVIYYIDTSSVFQGHFREANRYSAIADAPSRARRLAQEGDTVISMVRPSNEHIGFIDFDTDNYVFSNGFVVVHPNSEIVEPFYLYLLLSLDSTTRYLQQIAETSTTAYPSVKVEDIGNLSFDIPEISKQRKIVHKIRIIEQKIKLNQEINDNLAA